MFHSIIHSAWRRKLSSSSRQGRYRMPATKLVQRLWLERLEDRTTPAAHIGSMTFPTIQAAVNAAMSGDTITVDPGIYNELVTVNKSVNLFGAQVGVDARNPARTGLPATESVVDGNNGSTAFDVTASNVTIDGFTVEGETNANQFGFGILLGAGTSGAHVLNNIIQDNIAGLSLANSGTAALIQHNLFRNNNQPGPVSGTGIYSDQFNAGGNLNNVTIDANTFLNDTNDGVIIGPTDPTEGALNITISNNTFDGDGNAVLLFNTSVSSITGNTIRNSTSSQVVIGGGVNGLRVAQNFIQNGATRGIRIGDFGGGSPNSNVTVFDNSIQGNPTAGLELDSTGYTGALDARNNWWGSNTGPTIASNPGGKGDRIIDPNSQVNYRPWLFFGVDTQPNTPGFQGDLTETFHQDDIAARVVQSGDLWVGVSTGSSFTSSDWGRLDPSATWVDVITGDFNGDGTADIAARDANTGKWWVGLSNGSAFTMSVWTTWSTGAPGVPVTWADVQVGDFNGDGKADIIGRYAEGGQWWLALSNGSSFTNSLWNTWSPSATWVDAKVGDFNGDGKADLTARDLHSGAWWTGLSTGSSFTTTLWAIWSTAATWVDVQVGDFNGDGKADITGRVSESGEWWTGISTGSTFNTDKWAIWSTGVTWVDVHVGDFNGDGSSDIIGRALETGEWWVGRSNQNGTPVLSLPGFITTRWSTWSTAVKWVDVQVGDFNGDGQADITGRALQTGDWWTGISSGSAFTTTKWATWSTGVTWTGVRTGDFA